MVDSMLPSKNFTVVGENIHATRVVRRNGRRAVTMEDGTEAVPFRNESGAKRHLTDTTLRTGTNKALSHSHDEGYRR